MFSGIITSLQKPTHIEKTKEDMRLVFPIPKGWKIYQGESIAIDGICSTIAKKTKDSFTVFYMPETLKRTSLLSLDDNHQYNLEQSLTLNSLVGGHFVNGHIDCTGRVASIALEKESKVISIGIPHKFSSYIIYKGSVAVNGVSLTVVSIKNDDFTVSLIPYTLEQTNLGALKKNDMVNIEVDMMAKYIEKLLDKK